MTKSYALYKKKAKLIKAMGHSTRLMIIEALEKKETCVCELQKMCAESDLKNCGCDMSTISKHLSVLKNAGIVSIRKDKNQIFYKLKYPCLLSFMPCVEGVLEKQLNEQKQILKKQRRKNGIY